MNDNGSAFAGNSALARDELQRTLMRHRNALAAIEHADRAAVGPNQVTAGCGVLPTQTAGVPGVYEFFHAATKHRPTVGGCPALGPAGILVRSSR